MDISLSTRPLQPNIHSSKHQKQLILFNFWHHISLRWREVVDEVSGLVKWRGWLSRLRNGEPSCWTRERAKVSWVLCPLRTWIESEYMVCVEKTLVYDKCGSVYRSKHHFLILVICPVVIFHYIHSGNSSKACFFQPTTTPPFEPVEPCFLGLSQPSVPRSLIKPAHPAPKHHIIRKGNPRITRALLTARWPRWPEIWGRENSIHAFRA